MSNYFLRIPVTGVLFVAALPCAVVHAEDDIVFKHDIDLTAGVNNKLDDHKYGIANINASLGKKWDNDFGVKFNAKGKFKYFGKGHKDNKVDEDLFWVEGETPVGTLYFGAINKKGASEMFYKDLSGMAIDVVGYKRKYSSLSWKGQAGDFEYAISTRDLSNDDHKEISYGAQYKFDNWTFAAGYDQKSEEQKQALAASAQYQHDIGGATNKYNFSAIRRFKGDDYALGFAVESKLDNGLTLGAHYALNEVSKRENGYGVSAKYKQDNWSAKGKWEYSEKGYWKGKISGQIEFADFAPEGTTLYAGYEYREDKSEDTGFHAAAMFGLHKNVKLGVSYSDVNETGEYDFLKGTSLFFRAEL